MQHIVYKKIIYNIEYVCSYVNIRCSIKIKLGVLVAFITWHQ